MLCYVTTTFDGKERHSAFPRTPNNNGQQWPSLIYRTLARENSVRSSHGISFAPNAFNKQSIWPGEAGGATFAPIPVCPDPFVAWPIPCGNSTKIKFQQISIKILLWYFTKLKKTASVLLVAIEWAINLTESEWEYDINCQNFDQL